MDSTHNTNQWRLALFVALFSAMMPTVSRFRVYGEEINADVDNTLNGHKGRVRSVVFLPDGETIISAGLDDNTVRLWNVGTKTQTLLLEDRDFCGCISLTPDGRTLASTSFSTYTVADPESPLGYSIGPITGHVTLRDLRAGPSRTLTNDDYKIGMTPGGASPDIRTLHIVFSPDGEMLASANFRGTVTLWDIKTEKVLRTLETPADSLGYSGCMAFSPNRKALAWADGYGVGGDEHGVDYGKKVGVVLLLDVKTGKQIRQLTGLDGMVDSVAFTPDGKTLASLTYTEIKLWDVESGKLKHTIDDFANQQLAIAPDGKTFASVGYDITLWDMATGKMIVKIKDKHTTFYSVAFSPDGKTLAVGGAEGGGISLWKVEGNRLELIPPAADGTGEP